MLASILWRWSCAPHQLSWYTFTILELKLDSRWLRVFVTCTGTHTQWNMWILCVIETSLDLSAIDSARLHGKKSFCNSWVLLMLTKINQPAEISNLGHTSIRWNEMCEWAFGGHPVAFHSHSHSLISHLELQPAPGVSGECFESKPAKQLQTTRSLLPSCYLFFLLVFLIAFAIDGLE